MSADRLEEVELFVADLQRQEASPLTRRNYASDLDSFARWFRASLAEELSAKAITPTDIREYRSYLLNIKRRKAATVNRHLAAIRKFCQWARGTGRIRELPTEGVKGVASSPTAPRWLPKRDVDRLLREAERESSLYKGKRNLALLVFLRHTGLRVSELAGLRLRDVQHSERKGQILVRSGKGAKQRSVPLNVDARRALEAYLQVRPSTTDDHVFIGQRGVGIKSQAIENVVKKYAARAGLSDVTPHTLRHSMAKHLLEAGEDLVTVGRLLGHERIETTARYTTPSEQDLERAVSRLERDADLAS
jgi:site-specific recombinase XerD